MKYFYHHSHEINQLNDGLYSADHWPSKSMISKTLYSAKKFLDNLGSGHEFRIFKLVPAER